MSTASLPKYTPGPEFIHTPIYTERPRPHEHRLALNEVVRPRQGDFVKQSKGGGISLRLTEQDDHANLPEYGCGSDVEGTVTIQKTDGVQSVEVKIEGLLQMKEIAEGGTTTSTLCLDRATLWNKSESASCPSSLPFSLTLPTTYSDVKGTYPLPPTYEVRLDGLPGFRANIDYTVSVSVNRGRTSLFGLGNSALSTPFVYRPRTRPAVPLPLSTPGPKPTPDWKRFEGTLKARTAGGKDIIAQLYLPASRIFCLSQPIPFHVIFTSSAFSLASFMPYGPIVSLLSPTKQYTRIELLRQATVDVRNAVVAGTKTDMWRVDKIGQGNFRHAGDGPDWISFSGEIKISNEIKVGGFKAGGLHVKDCVVLSMIPSEPQKCPFAELRQVIPIRLTTDAWSIDYVSLGDPFHDSESSTEDYVEAQPELNYSRT